jgi:signal transduction histidine kinase/ligand-binding sensor domain-containing protein
MTRKVRLVPFMLGLAVAVGTGSLHAQRYHTRIYTEGNGLPSSTVYGITQGADGRMWFATRAGVAVWDGYAWAEPGAVQSDLTSWRMVEVDDAGRVWRAASNGSIATLNGGDWVPIPRPPLPNGCPLQSFEVLGSDETVRVAVGAECGLMLWSGEGWLAIPAATSFPFAAVRDVRAAEDRLFVATDRGLGLMRASETQLRAAPGEVPRSPIAALAVEPGLAPAVWVVGTDWIGRLDGDDFTLLDRGLGLSVSDPVKAVAGGDGSLYVGDEPSVYRYVPEDGLQLLDEDSGLVGGGALNLFRDREHNIWIATTRGVSKLMSLRFASYVRDHGLLENEVTAIVKRSAGGIVLAHPNGLSLVENELATPSRGLIVTRVVGAETKRGRLLDLTEDRDGTLWIADSRRGLGRLEEDRLVWSQPVPDGAINSVVVDGANVVWIAAQEELIALRRGRAERYPMDGLSGRAGLRRLFVAADDRLLVATSGAGLLAGRPGSWRRWQHPDREDLNNVFAVHERPDGTLWAGTSGGLVVADGESLEPARAPLPVVHRPVYFITPGRSGDVWLGTDNGVLHWDGVRLRHLTVEQGLAARETNRAASLVDENGAVWIGTTGGLSIYREELDLRTPVPPLVTLLTVEASGTPVADDPVVHLGSRDHDLSFGFRAISFRDDETPRLQTWLEGAQEDWTESVHSSVRDAHYTNLRPGRYRFHIRAGNSVGLWSEPVSSGELIIARPLWARGWFWVVTVLLVGAAFYSVQRYVYQVRYARQLESEVQLRVEDLKRAETELTRAQRLESLGLLAGGIAHDFNNLLMAILGNLSLLGQSVTGGARRWIVNSEAAVRRARDLTQQLMTFSRGGAPVRTPTRVEDLVRESTLLALRGTNVRCTAKLQPDVGVANVDAGQITQVLNNLLINAVQAMPDGGTVRIRGDVVVDDVPDTLEPGRYVRVAVEDEGSGIEPENLSRVFDPYFTTKSMGSGLGLSTAYSIVRRHGGLLTVDSCVGRGSVFTIYLPASLAEVPERKARPRSAQFDGLRVLVMDDQQMVRDVITTMLVDLGCAVESTVDGEEALERYTEARAGGEGFDVVIVDLTVQGGMGGEELTRRLLAEIDPEAQVIVASGYSNSPVVADYEDHGFRAALIKPFSREQLADVLAQVVGGRVSLRT